MSKKSDSDKRSANKSIVEVRKDLAYIKEHLEAIQNSSPPTASRGQLAHLVAAQTRLDVVRAALEQLDDATS